MKNVNDSNMAVWSLVEFVNCLFFFRRQLTQLISTLNEQKRKIKKNGVVVDGKKYQIKFTGI